MKISNKNIRSFISIGTMLLGLVAIADLIFLIWSGALGNLLHGYGALVVPAIIAGAYAYLGLPIFQFNTKSNVLHIKSHMAFSSVFGKDLYILKKNILRFEIDTVRIRKKLTVHYLKDGKEFKETFSISLLSNKKIAELAKEVDLIQSENGWSSNSHLFI